MENDATSLDPTQHAQVRDEQMRIAFSQTTKGVVGGITAGILFTLAFWPVAPRGLLLGWLFSLISVSGLRALFYLRYLKRGRDSTLRSWERQFMTGTLLHAMAWGIAWWLFIPVAGEPEYTLIVALWLTGLSAASFSAYIVYLPSMMAFFLPVVVPGIARILTLGGSLETTVALGLCLYTGIIISSMLPIHRAMIAAIRLNFQNANEISERKRAEAKLREISIRDGLTGLATRRHFEEELASELLRAQRNASPLSLMLIDIDSFKTLNDTRGHIEGDACLKRVAERVRLIARRPGDLAARYGGEEFVVILPGTPADEAYALAEHLRADIEAMALEHTTSLVEHTQVVTVSIGVYTLTPVAGTHRAHLLQPADDALYRAKRNGRNRVEAGHA